MSDESKQYIKITDVEPLEVEEFSADRSVYYVTKYLVGIGRWIHPVLKIETKWSWNNNNIKYLYNPREAIEYLESIRMEFTDYTARINGRIIKNKKQIEKFFKMKTYSKFFQLYNTNFFLLNLCKPDKILIDYKLSEIPFNDKINKAIGRL